MERLFFECAVRAALLVAGTALVLYAMRVKAAAARHSVWASVVLLMLVLPIWTAWGPKASLHVLPPLAQTTATEAIAPVRTISIAFLPSSLAATLQSVLLGVYLLGLSLLMLRLAIGTVRARRLVREAVSQDGMCISSLCAAPVTVGFFHPTVIVPEHWRQWPQTQLDAVEGGQVPRISRTRMACVTAACAITCTVFAAGKLDRTRQIAPQQSTKTESEAAPDSRMLEILTPTEGVDFTVFDSHLIQAVKGNWYAKMHQDAKKGDKGKVVVRFKVQQDGTLQGRMPRVEVSSGKKVLDNAAVAAIRASTPFDHLPELFKGPNIELRLIFLYNLPLPAQHS